jgi:hypothetical protein
MRLHDRHGPHITLQTPLKQARQSLARPPAGRRSAGFPYSASLARHSGDLPLIFVNFS